MLYGGVDQMQAFNWNVRMVRAHLLVFQILKGAVSEKEELG